MVIRYSYKEALKKEKQKFPDRTKDKLPSTFSYIFYHLTNELILKLILYINYKFSNIFLREIIDVLCDFINHYLP